jgi:hypothetical protein
MAARDDVSMGPFAPRLDLQLLHVYEERLRSVGAPVAEWVRPGLTAEQIEETVAPLGLRLPAEARVWWEWHDGATVEGRERLLGPSNECLTLEDAMEVYQECRATAEETAGAWPENDPDFLWSPAWFPVSGWQLPIVVDCSVADYQSTPIRFVDWQNVDRFFQTRAGSLGQMVSWWIEAIDVGAWEWSGADRQWLSHDLPEWAQRTNPLI